MVHRGENGACLIFDTLHARHVQWRTHTYINAFGKQSQFQRSSTKSRSDMSVIFQQWANKKRVCCIVWCVKGITRSDALGAVECQSAWTMCWTLTQQSVETVCLSGPLVTIVLALHTYIRTYVRTHATGKPLALLTLRQQWDEGLILVCVYEGWLTDMIVDFGIWSDIIRTGSFRVHTSYTEYHQRGKCVFSTH